MHCGAEVGHYNGCTEDPDAMCLCHLCMDERMTTDPIGEALHADAEAARQEIREAGLVCPSCGVNMGDLYGKGHRYERAEGRIAITSDVVQCATGEPVATSSLTYEQMQAVANIDLLDDFVRAEDEAFGKMLGVDRTG